MAQKTESREGLSPLAVPPGKLIQAVSEHLKKEIRPPEWSKFVKTGVHKERAPSQEDWWYLRTASVLRKLYLRQPMGVSKFRRAYGGRKNKGHKPEHKYLASGAIIRKVLQQLEQAGYTEQEKGKGRKISGCFRLRR